MYEIKVQKKSFALELGKKTKTNFVPKQNGNYHYHTMPTEVWYTESLVR